jgi:hypothetical protein
LTGGLPRRPGSDRNLQSGGLRRLIIALSMWFWNIPGKSSSGKGKAEPAADFRFMDVD